MSIGQYDLIESDLLSAKNATGLGIGQMPALDQIYVLSVVRRVQIMEMTARSVQSVACVVVHIKQITKLVRYGCGN